MNIQIFGRPKSFDTQKAQRYFKERGVKFQYIDLKEKGISPGELRSVRAAVGKLEALIDEKARQGEHSWMLYLGDPSQVEAKLLEHPEFLKVPIVRNGRLATVGYCPEVWKDWE